MSNAKDWFGLVSMFNTTPVEINQKKKKHVEEKKIKTIDDLRCKNLILFEINPETKEVKRAELKPQESKVYDPVNKKGVKDEHYVINPNFIYVWKMNLKSAEKHAKNI